MNSRKSLYIPLAPAALYARRRIAACAPCGQARFLAILRHPYGSRRTEVMAKLRHIALIVPDPEKAAKFFEDAFDMKVAGKARRGLYVSDGTVNVALLKQEGDEEVGIYHFGMWVDDLDEAEKKVVGAGGKYLAGRPEPSTPGATAHSYYEAKYKDPLGIVFDLTHTGWVGAVKDVVAAKN
jgi:lactoylglutathione lyase